MFSQSTTINYRGGCKSPLLKKNSHSMETINPFTKIGDLTVREFEVLWSQLCEQKPEEDRYIKGDPALATFLGCSVSTVKKYKQRFEPARVYYDYDESRLKVYDKRKLIKILEQ